MIYHKLSKGVKCGGVVRTKVTNSSVFECNHCGTTWTEKQDMWQDSVINKDVSIGTYRTDEVDAVTSMEAVGDKGAPRVGTVDEKDVPAKGIFEP